MFFGELWLVFSVFVFHFLITDNGFRVIMNNWLWWVCDFKSNCFHMGTNKLSSINSHTPVPSFQWTSGFSLFLPDAIKTRVVIPVFSSHSELAATVVTSHADDAFFYSNGQFHCSYTNAVHCSWNCYLKFVSNAWTTYTSLVILSARCLSKYWYSWQFHWIFYHHHYCERQIIRQRTVFKMKTSPPKACSITKRQILTELIYFLPWRLFTKTRAETTFVSALSFNVD